VRLERELGVLKSIVDQIHSLIAKPCFTRPFVCDGLPEQCAAIVIGENPVTPLGTDWWSFWDDRKGFDLQNFELFYENERKHQGKGPVSNTRRRLNRIRVSGLKCLETNAYSNEGPGGHGSGGKSNTILLDMFLTEIPRLKAVIAHGRVAEAFLRAKSLPAGVSKHYMRSFRQESYEKVDQLVKDVLAR
jgi:hypothetical protein